MIAVGDSHELVGEAEVEMALVEISVPVAAAVVPGEVHLAPLAVYANGVPSVPISDYAPVGDAGGVQELGVDALVALAGAKPAGETALRGAPVEAAVVFELVKRPIVQPEGHGVFGAVGFAPASRDGVIDDPRDRRASGVANGYLRRSAQIPDAAVAVQEVEVDAIGAGGGEFEGVVVAVGAQGVVGLPIAARGVAYDFLRAAVEIDGDVHAHLRVGGPAGLRDVEGGGGAGGGVVPLYGERDAVLLCGCGMGVGSRRRGRRLGSLRCIFRF